MFPGEAGRGKEDAMVQEKMGTLVGPVHAKKETLTWIWIRNKDSASMNALK
jgi:hypothetical protein